MKSCKPEKERLEQVVSKTKTSEMKTPARLRYTSKMKFAITWKNLSPVSRHPGILRCRDPGNSAEIFSYNRVDRDSPVSRASDF